MDYDDHPNDGGEDPGIQDVLMEDAEGVAAGVPAAAGLVGHEDNDLFEDVDMDEVPGPADLGDDEGSESDDSDLEDAGELEEAEEIAQVEDRRTDRRHPQRRTSLHLSSHLSSLRTPTPAASTP